MIGQKQEAAAVKQCSLKFVLPTLLDRRGNAVRKQSLF
jgi:hypothetical protein